MTDTPKPKAIIFDLDDTLVSTFQTRAQTHIVAAKKFYDLTFTLQDIANVWGQPYKQMMVSLYGNIDQVDNIIKNYESLITNYPIPVYPGVPEALNQLSQSYVLGILTAAPEHLVTEIFDYNHIDKSYFIHIQTAEDTPVHKPDPQVFQPILASLEQHNIKPSQTLYVGDALRDYFAARDAGLQFLGVTSGLDVDANFSDQGANYVHSIPEVISWLST